MFLVHGGKLEVVTHEEGEWTALYVDGECRYVRYKGDGRDTITEILTVLSLPHTVRSYGITALIPPTKIAG